MRTLVIKPCERDSRWNIKAEFIQLHTTQVEKVLAYKEYFSTTHRKKHEAFQIWNYMHNIWQTTALWWVDKWTMLSQRLHDEIGFEQEYARWKEWEFLINKLNTNSLVEDWAEFWWWRNYICSEKQNTVFIELGKYYLCITAKLDLVCSDWQCYDLKSAGSLWIPKKELLPEYNKDNYLDSMLSDKRQWFWYTFLHWYDMWVEEWEKYFTYMIGTKHKKTQYQNIVCKVDLEWAQWQFIEDIKLYFTLLHEERKAEEDVQDGRTYFAL